MKIRKNLINFLIFLIFCLIIFQSILRISKKSGKNTFLSVNSPDGEFIYSLEDDRILKIKGAIGISTIQIKDGGACFLDSPCPNKTCVSSGFVRKGTDWAACLPNEVFIYINSEADEADVLTR